MNNDEYEYEPQFRRKISAGTTQKKSGRMLITWKKGFSVLGIFACSVEH